MTTTLDDLRKDITVVCAKLKASDVDDMPRISEDAILLGASKGRPPTLSDFSPEVREKIKYRAELRARLRILTNRLTSLSSGKGSTT